MSEQALSEILKAVSDTTRRSLLTQMVQQGPTRVTALASFYDLSLNAVSKHIKALERAGLARRRQVGRDHWIEANLEPLKELGQWFKFLRSNWDMRLDRLNDLLTIGEIAMTELSISLTKTINAPVERVFNAWLNAETLSKFMTPMPGMAEPRTETDGKEGGRFRILMLVDDQEIPHEGTYLEVEPYSKIAFTWESPFSVDGSVVTILFNALPGDRTSIDFSHVKFKGEEERSDHEGGWGHILDKLESLTASALERATA